MKDSATNKEQKQPPIKPPKSFREWLELQVADPILLAALQRDMRLAGKVKKP